MSKKIGCLIVLVILVIVAIMLVLGLMVIGSSDGSKFVGVWVNDSGREVFQLYSGGSGILNQKHPVTKDYIRVSWGFKKNRIVVTNEDFGIGMGFILSDSKLTQLDGDNRGRILTKKE